MKIFPDNEPLALAGGQTSELFEFSVPAEPAPRFLRIIALWRDNTPFEGAAPTFQIKMAQGEIRSVPVDGDPVLIPGLPGGGQASCQSQGRDIYVLEVVNHTEQDLTWKLRITNNTNVTLRFVWVHAETALKTKAPWMVIDGDLSIASRSLGSFVTVRNWGTETLRIHDIDKTPIGPPDSPVVLASRPSKLPPHGVDHFAFTCGEVSSPKAFAHTFTANDDNLDHTTLRVAITPL